MPIKPDRQKEITRRELFAGATALGLSLLGESTVQAAGLSAPTETSVKPAANSVNSLKAPNDAPNVVYIMADDLGWADVGYHAPSEVRTPHIDRLVSEGMELDRFYGCPVCSPSRACALTGRSAMRYGMIYAVVRPWDTHGIPQKETMLPEAFQAAGYQTWMVGKWHLGHWNAKLTPNARGFDHFYGFVCGEIDYYKHEREQAVDWQRNGKTLKEKGYSTDLLADEAVRLIQNRNKNAPFFLYLPFNAPHQPLMAPDDLVQSYSSIKDVKRRTYAAMVTSLDMAIGRIRQALQDSGAGSNTLIVFHGDNGGQLLQGAVNLPLRDGKSTVFEGGIRVPAFLHYPAVLPQGKRSKQVVTNLDLFPTLAAATGIPANNGSSFDGLDMWQHLKEDKIVPREDLYFAVGERGYWRHAIFHQEWKFILEQSQADQSEQTYLFRIDEDPYEKNNLAEANGPLVKTLKERIATWRSLHPEGDIGVSSKRHPGFVSPAAWADCSIS